MSETTLFWHAECPIGHSIDCKTTGEHKTPLPESVSLTCFCGFKAEARRVTQGEHGAYVADCTGAGDCPAYYHEHGCFADMDGSRCNDAEAHI